jgi:hypothetical protein
MSEDKAFYDLKEKLTKYNEIINRYLKENDLKTIV